MLTKLHENLSQLVLDDLLFTMYKLLKPLRRNLHLPSIIERFPENVVFSFAYGSGAFQQANTDAKTFKNNMFDLILVVDDVHKFHVQNFSKNSKDYSLTNRIFLNPQRIADFQRTTGNKTWFHPFVKNALPNGQLLKYGVVELSDFENDMVNWSDLYLSGRLHKPVKKYFPKKDLREKIENLIKMNREQALNTALLLLAEDVNEVELYEKIASLSYEGDIRNKGMENPNKVKNIVKGQLEEFKMIYRPLLEEYKTGRLELEFDKENKLLENGEHNDDTEIEDADHIFQDLSAVTILNKLNACPLNLQVQIAKIAGKDDRQRRDVEEVLRTVARHPIPSDFVEKGVGQIVGEKTRAQIILTTVSAGPKRALIYALEKFKKGMQKK